VCEQRVTAAENSTQPVNTGAGVARSTLVVMAGLGASA